MSGGLVQISECVAERFAELESIRSGNFSGSIPTGFDELDKIMQGGIRPSDLIVVAGRPSMGKTAFMMACALNIAQQGRSVGMFSLEMSARGLVGRLLSMKSLVDNSHIRTGEVNEEEMSKLRYAGEILSSLPIYIDDTGGIPIPEMYNRILAQPVDVVMVDYLQLLGGHGNLSETERVTRVSRELKELSKTVKLPFMVACQLSRSVETRKNKKPMLSDLRQSGQIEQDADAVVAMYRPEVYDDSPEYAGYAEALVIKQRDGGLGTAKMGFAGKYSLFSNWEPDVPVPSSEYNEGMTAEEYYGKSYTDLINEDY
jgi:replicative DNA helicase